MARKSNSNTEKVVVEKEATTFSDENKINTSTNIGSKKKIELDDNEEIEVISLVSNVSYKDSKTGDMYEWDEVGHVEFMTVETIKNLWRGNKSYFKNLWLKPDDERVIEKLGIKNIYDKYEILMDESNYTKGNIDKICDVIDTITSSSLKSTVINKVKLLIMSGDVSDINVIKKIENKLDIDLISFI